MKGISAPPVKVDNITLEKNAAQELQAIAGVLMKYVDTRFEVVSFSRDISLASGNQAVTLTIQKTPKAILFFATQNSGTVGASWGVDDLITPSSIDEVFTANNWVADGGYSIRYDPASGSTYIGKVTSVGVGTFTISWTKLGTPTGIISGRGLVFF